MVRRLKKNDGRSRRDESTNCTIIVSKTVLIKKRTSRISYYDRGGTRNTKDPQIPHPPHERRKEEKRVFVPDTEEQAEIRPFDEFVTNWAFSIRRNCGHSHVKRIIKK